VRGCVGSGIKGAADAQRVADMMGIDIAKTKKSGAEEPEHVGINLPRLISNG